MARVELYANGQFIADDTTSLYGFSWDSTLAADGSVSLVTYAYDRVGNEGISSPVNVLVDNSPDPINTTPPSMTITEPADNSAVSGTAHIQVGARDNMALAAIRLSINGVLKSVTDTSPLSYSWNTRKEAQGFHNISVVAEDSAGNTSTTFITVKVSSGNKNTGGGKGKESKNK